MSYTGSIITSIHQLQLLKGKLPTMQDGLFAKPLFPNLILIILILINIFLILIQSAFYLCLIRDLDVSFFAIVLDNRSNHCIYVILIAVTCGTL